MKKLKISLLKQARKLVISKKEQFICIALNQVAKQSYDFGAVQASLDLQEYIHAAIQGAFTLESWIVDHAKHLGKKQDRVLMITDEFMVNARVQWIDWMIKQLEETK